MIEGQIMSSYNEEVDINEVKEANKKDAKDEVKTRVTEAQKRYQVARELEEHRLFKDLKRSADDNNISIMLDVIVDTYFDFVSGNDDNLPTYVVDASLIVMALQQTRYLINATENGIILNDDGSIDVEASLEEQKVMGNVRLSFDSLTDEEKKDVIVSLLEKSKDKGEVLDKVDANFLLKSLEGYDSKKLNEYLKTDEGKEIINAALNGENNHKKIKKNRIDANLEDEEDVRINEIQGRIYSILSKTDKGLSQAKYEELYSCLHELEAFKDGWAKKFLDENGNMSPTLIMEDYVKYVGSYTAKEHEKTLQQYGGKTLQKVYSFDKLPPDHKRKVMEAALSLYMQPEGQDRSEAMIVLSALDVLKDDKNNEKVIDIDAFRALYNSTQKDSNLTYEAILKRVWEKDVKSTQAHTKMLYQQVLDGTFTERSDESLREENKEKDQEEEFVIKDDKPKEKFWDKVNRRLYENYEKGLEFDAIKKFDKLTQGLSDVEKADCIKKAYASTAYKLGRKKTLLRGLQENGTKDKLEIEKVEMEILKLQETNSIVARYMLRKENARIFGDAIDQGEIKSGKIKYNAVKWSEHNDAKRKELEEKGITPKEIVGIFDEVADYEMTPGRIARGMLESTKDVAGVLYRKVKFSLLGKMMQDKVLALADKNFRSLNTAEEAKQF